MMLGWTLATIKSREFSHGGSVEFDLDVVKSGIIECFLENDLPDYARIVAGIITKRSGQSPDIQNEFTAQRIIARLNSRGINGEQLMELINDLHFRSFPRISPKSWGP
jgi:hypothetical protein